MRKIVSLLFIAIYFCNTAFSISDTSIHKNAEPVEIYAETEPKDATKDCIPCRIEYYDENYNFKSRFVKFSNEQYGEFVDYYPNGKIRATGKCVKNPHGDCGVGNEDNCKVPDGTWTFYKKNGAIDYQEFWDNGQFLGQEPLQNKTEIWDMALMLDGVRIDSANRNVKIRMEELDRLSVVPLFKNEKTKVTISIDLFANLKTLEPGQGSIYTSYVQKKLKNNSLEGQEFQLEGYIEHFKLPYTELQVQLIIKANKYTIDYINIEFVE